MPDTLNTVTDELRALSPRARRQVLARLSSAERALVEQRLQGGEAEVPAEVAAAQSGDELSAWLSRAVAAVRSGKGGAITPLAGAALLESVDALRRRMPAPAAETRKEPGRSLVEAFGGLMPARRVR